ncbi:MAG: hypothetical protein ACE5E9_03905 [Nitrospinaceae bacterium]
MVSYTYELLEPDILLSRVRQGLLVLGEDWAETASFMREGHVEYHPIRNNPIRSGYRFFYQRAKLNLTLYFPEKIFDRMLEWLDREKLELLKEVIQASIPQRSGYELHELRIRGILGEDENGATLV